MHSAGTDPPEIIQGRIINVNLVKWTVDIFSTFDRKRYLDIPVASPYLHFNNGEGLSIFPEVGAVCMLCVPGDSSGPFILCFVMPHEVVNGATDDAPIGTRSHGTPQGASDASFAGNRPLPKPGDIYLKGRDGNFLILHRGGVLQVGSTELAQRIYIPLGNLVTDISENYAHHNSGGSITWGLQDGPSQDKIPTQYQHMFRVYANEKYADIKMAMGKVYAPLAEPEGAIPGVGVGDDNPIVFEIAVAPQGFDAETGDPATPATVKNTVFHFVYDRKGNMFTRFAGDVALQMKKTLSLTVDGDITITGKKSFVLNATEGATINGGASTHIKGTIVRLGPGAIPVARMGDVVTSFITMMPCTIIPSLPLVAPGVPVPCIISIGAPPAGLPPLGIGGTITTAEPTVLA